MVDGHLVVASSHLEMTLRIRGRRPKDSQFGGLYGQFPTAVPQLPVVDSSVNIDLSIDNPKPHRRRLGDHVVPFGKGASRANIPHWYSPSYPPRGSVLIDTGEVARIVNYRWLPQRQSPLQGDRVDIFQSHVSPSSTNTYNIVNK